MFLGRHSELNELEKRWASDRFEMGIVYGARRIGKTSLLKEFVKGKNAFYFQARLEEEKNNLAAFSREFHLFLGQDLSSVYLSFEDALNDVARYARQRKMIFVIDEIAYLCSKSQAMLSTLQFFIDHAFQETGMLLILSGSNISFMEELLKNRNSPLYQRATFQIHLQKMLFSEARSFIPSYTPEQQIETLALFGAHPYYLGMIRQTLSPEENIRELLYTKFGTLTDAPAKVLPAGTSASPMYHSLLKVIAHGKRFSKDIAEAVGQSTSYISQYLNALIETQAIEKRSSFIKNQKTNYYAVADQLLRFWYRFIFEKQDLIELGYGDSLFREDLPGIRDFLARGFEDVAILWLEEQNLNGRLPCLYEPIRNYVVEKSQLGRSIELDGLAAGYGANAHRLLVMECKYRNIPFDKQMLSHLQESVSIFDRYSEMDLYIFSKSGFTDAVAQLDDPHLHLITPEIMCQPYTSPAS